MQWLAVRKERERKKGNRSVLGSEGLTERQVRGRIKNHSGSHSLPLMAHVHWISTSISKVAAASLWNITPQLCLWPETWHTHGLPSTMDRIYGNLPHGPSVAVLSCWQSSVSKWPLFVHHLSLQDTPLFTIRWPHLLSNGSFNSLASFLGHATHFLHVLWKLRRYHFCTDLLPDRQTYRQSDKRKTSPPSWSK